MCSSFSLKLAAVSCSLVCGAYGASVKFEYTGGTVEWTVPNGITTVAFEAIGASGGSVVNQWGGYQFYGGLGGKVRGNLAVTAGDKLYITIGGVGQNGYSLGAAGGFNGGGSSGAYGGGGGGGTDIRFGGASLSHRVVVAGGGGGAANSAIALGDYSSGRNGNGGGSGPVTSTLGAGTSALYSGGGGGHYGGTSGGPTTPAGGGSNYADQLLTSGVFMENGALGSSQLHSISGELILTYADDTTPPLITLIGDNPQTVYRGTTFSDLGATVTDDFDATRTIMGTGTVDTSTVGTYTLTYSTQDEVGNVATPVTRTVEVVLDPNGDEDNDGLNNTEEANLGTNPYLRDTDSDGVNDLREVGDQTDPLDPASFNSLSQGLVAYYPFNGNANDESGNGRNGAAFGVAFEEDGLKTGKSARFGGQQRIEADFTGCRPQRVTISVWVKPTTDARHGSYYVLHRPSYPNGFTQWHVGWNKDNPPNYNRLGSRFVFDQDNNPFLRSGELQVGQWYHVVTTFDGTAYKMFLNGVLIDSLDANAYTLMYLSDSLYIGWRENGSEGFTGSIDEVKIYERGLSSDEVALLYANELYAGFGLEGAASKSPFDPATAENWSAGGDGWTVDTTTTHDGVDSVKAQTTDGQSTYREYTVTGPAVVDFWWKVSSEQIYDTFTYSLNGVDQETISGEGDWTYRTLTLPEGTHTIRWTYAKDGSDAVGQDAGWLDEFAVYPSEATLQVRDGETVLDGEVTVDFGDADIGSAGFTKTLNFANEGYVPLEVDLSLPADSPFSFLGGATTLPMVIQRGQSADVRIFLSTESTGTKTALLTVDAPDSTLEPPQVTLTGDVLGPVIGVSFGGSPLAPDETVDMGLAPKTLEFTIRNEGNVGNLDITQISTTGNFQIVEQPSASITPQGSTTFKILAQSGSIGSQTGSVVISSSDGFTPTFTIPLTAEVFFGTADGITDGTVATSGTGEALGWSLVSTQLPDGSTGQALKTGTTPNGENSVLEMVAEGAAVVSWSWRASAQENFDWLLCEVDGQEVAGISAKNGVWQTQVVQVSAGASIRWVYRKDAAFTAGEDAGYLADVAFTPMSGDLSFADWSATHGINDPNARLPRSGMSAMFAWLGGADPATGPEAGHHRPIMEGDRLKYRFPISKAADGTQQIQFSSDLSSWTSRGMSQRVLSEDGNRMVVEATAPSGTKGFFKVVGSGDTSMVWVEGGALPQSSQLAGTAVVTFQIGKTEVTLAEWRQVRDWAALNGYDDLPEGRALSSQHPVSDINWYDAVKWCNAKSEKEGLKPVYQTVSGIYRLGVAIPVIDSSSAGHRLPTEAEWEWAARGGIRSQGYIFSGSNDVDRVAWTYLTSADQAQPVGTKLPNELGLLDMSGNLIEWCWDEGSSSSYRMLRGGSCWIFDAASCLVSARYTEYTPDWTRDGSVGFRVARNAED